MELYSSFTVFAMFRGRSREAEPGAYVYGIFQIGVAAMHEMLCWSF